MYVGKRKLAHIKLKNFVENLGNLNLGKLLGFRPGKSYRHPEAACQRHWHVLRMHAMPHVHSCQQLTLSSAGLLSSFRLARCLHSCSPSSSPPAAGAAAGTAWGSTGSAGSAGMRLLQCAIAFIISWRWSCNAAAHRSMFATIA